MSKPPLDLLIESEQMRTILTSLTSLASQSDGVMINGKVVPWKEAFPLVSYFPDFASTSKQRDEWMAAASEDWNQKFQERVKARVARSVSADSSAENDNLYLWSLLSATQVMFTDVLDHTDKSSLRVTRPDLLQASQDLLSALSAVTSGTISTASVRNKLFFSGMDNVLMEFQMRHLMAKNEGRLEDEAKNLEIVTAILDIKEEALKQFPQ